MRLRLALVFAVLAGGLAPAVASAGTYDVYGCRLPDGTVAPTRGWTAFANIAADPSTNLVPTEDSCARGGALRATVYTQPGIGSPQSGWTFAAPADTAIAAVALQRYGQGYHDGQLGGLAYFAAFDAWPPAADGDPEGEACATTAPLGFCSLGSVQLTPTTADDFVRDGLRRSRLFLGLRCASQVCGAGPFIFPEPPLVIHAARITLSDDTAPTFTGEPRVDGDRIRVAAADRGGGLARLDLAVDGTTVASPALCSPPFVDPVPCPPSNEIAFDVSHLSDGDHEIVAQAVDVAGNLVRALPLRVSVLAGHVVTAVVPDSPPAIPAPAERVLRIAARARFKTLAYGRSGTIAGTVTDAGGAAVAAATVQIRDGARRDTTTTGSDGRFSYRLAAGPNRVVELAAAGASARVSVRVRAGVMLETSTRRVRNGTTLRFSGRLLGERTRGALVTIYALRDGPHARSTVATVRARTKGRFSYAYTFRSLQARTTFRFEARVVKQAGLPYETGTSRRVTVHGRP